MIVMYTNNLLESIILIYQIITVYSDLQLQSRNHTEVTQRRVATYVAVCVTGEVSVSVGVISTATITAGYSRSDCTSFTVNQNLESPGSTSEEVEEGVSGPSQATVEGCLKNTEV